MTQEQYLAFLRGWTAIAGLIAVTALWFNHMTALESATEKQFCKWVKTFGLEALKLRIDGTDGFPDRTVMKDGRSFLVEFKRTEKDRLRPQQRKQKKKLEDAGNVVLVTHSLETAKDEFTRWLNR